MCDIFLIQLGIVLNPTLAFEQILDRFGFKDWAQQNERQTSPDLELKRVEDMLRLIIHLASSRSYIGKIDSQKEKTRRDLIHCLAVQNYTRSKLIEELSQTYQEPKGLDEALKEVADYRQPLSATSPGVYSLKSQYWKNFDPYYYYYDRQNYQKAMENYSSKKPRIVSLEKIEEPIESFKNITNILHVPNLIQFYPKLIINATITKSPAYSPLLRISLHLLLMHLEYPISSNETINSNSHEIKQPTFRALSLLNTAADVKFCGISLLDCLIQLYR